MSPRRRWIAKLLVAFLIAGSGFDIVTGREHWPFSPYAMYSGLRRSPTLTRIRLFGVPAAASAPEFTLDRAMMRPFTPARLEAALRRLAHDPKDRPRLEAALRDILERYEAGRRDGRHDGPRLGGLKLFEVEWERDPTARNVARPSRRALIAAVAAPGAP